MNPLIEQNLRQSLKNLHSHADWIQFKYIKEDTHHRLVNNEKPKANDVKEDEGLMVEVLVNGQYAYSATQDTSVDGIQRATQKAIAQAKSSAPFGVFQFNEQKHRRASQGQYQSPSKTRWWKGCWPNRPRIRLRLYLSSVGSLSFFYLKKIFVFIKYRRHFGGACSQNVADGSG